LILYIIILLTNLYLLIFKTSSLNVLLTRGVNGLYIYAVDEELQEALKEAIL